MRSYEINFFFLNFSWQVMVLTQIQYPLLEVKKEVTMSCRVRYIIRNVVFVFFQRCIAKKELSKQIINKHVGYGTIVIFFHEKSSRCQGLDELLFLRHFQSFLRKPFFEFACRERKSSHNRI